MAIGSLCYSKNGSGHLCYSKNGSYAGFLVYKAAPVSYDVAAVFTFSPKSWRKSDADPTSDFGYRAGCGASNGADFASTAENDGEGLPYWRFSFTSETAIPSGTTIDLSFHRIKDIGDGLPDSTVTIEVTTSGGGSWGGTYPVHQEGMNASPSLTLRRDGSVG